MGDQKRLRERGSSLDWSRDYLLATCGRVHVGIYLDDYKRTRLTFAQPHRTLWTRRHG